VPRSLREELERLAAELADVGPPPPVQLYRKAKEADELTGPMLHVGVGLDMLRFEREQELRGAAVGAVMLGFSPDEVAQASGLDREWLLDQLG
jgi:hypothetical protein